MSDSVWPHRRQPTRLPHPWDSPGKNTGVVCHFLLQCMQVKSESEVAQSCPTLSDPWTAAYQAPLSMGFSKPEYWSGVPLPSPFVGLPLCICVYVWSIFIYTHIRRLRAEELVTFEFGCWRRLLRVPWTARRSNQSILKEINPECSLEGLLLKLRLQYFGHLMQTANSLEKTLMLGKIEGRWRRGDRSWRWLNGIID